MIKVEDTGAGDYVRWAPPFYGEDEHTPLGTRSALYLSLNRNKRSIRLDLKQEQGKQALLAMAKDADVLVESFRPGVLDRLGVGYEQLAKANPALVYCPITGYGLDGPNRDRAGHDQNYLGLNGILGLTGDADGAADPGRRPDRRPRRRRADGRGRHPRRAERGAALGPGPGRGRLDDRRLAGLAGDGRRAVPLRRRSPQAR